MGCRHRNSSMHNPGSKNSLDQSLCEAIGTSSSWGLDLRSFLITEVQVGRGRWEVQSLVRGERGTNNTQVQSLCPVETPSKWVGGNTGHLHTWKRKLSPNVKGVKLCSWLKSKIGKRTASSLLGSDVPEEGFFFCTEWEKVRVHIPEKFVLKQKSGKSE